MRRLAIILILVGNICWGQSPHDSVYNRGYIVKFAKGKNLSPSVVTKGMIVEINKRYHGEQEQVELIKFYKGVYDYKLVDKEILKRLVDSLIQYGQTEKIKSFAMETKTSVEYRLLGKKIRDFEFADKNGSPIRLSSLNEKVVIIELWATNCAPCVKEMRKIWELKKLNPNIEFYSISLDKTIEKMIKFVDKNKYDWPIVFGGESNKDLWNYLNIVAMPKYYTVDRSGTVINVADKLNDQFINSLR